MTGTRLGHVATALVGALIGAVFVLTVAGEAPGHDIEPDSVTEVPTLPYEVTEGPARAAASKLLLAWSPMGSGGLPTDTERILERMDVVRDATTVRAGLVWLNGSVSADGTRLDSPPDGLAIPIEIAIIEPAEYSNFVAPGDRGAFLRLRSGDAVIPRTEAELRGAADGMELNFEDFDATVTWVVSDVATNGYEVVIPPPVPASMKVVERFVLVHLRDAKARRAVAAKIRGSLGPGQVLRVRAEGETPFLRYGDAVAPGLLVKENFGEFAARPLPDGRIAIENRWQNENIRSASIPVLGRVVCHRAVIPQLRRAMRTVRERGLGFLIDESQYGGCFGPRFISRDPRGRLSHHSWGIAIDLNVADNAFGTKGDQDQRLVEIMEGAGFTWGGRWLVPDAMHFEWTVFP